MMLGSIAYPITSKGNTGYGILLEDTLLNHYALALEICEEQLGVELQSHAMLHHM
jgi:hypothetical protein